MKVAHIVCVYPPYGGGMGVVAANLAKMTAEEGIETAVFTPRQPGQAESAIDGDVSIFRFDPWLSVGHGAYLPSFGRWLDGYSHVVFHYPFFGMAGAVIRAQRSSKFDLIAWHHMDPGRLAGIKAAVGFFLRPIERGLLRRCGMIAVSSLDYWRSTADGRALRGVIDEPVELPFTADRAYSESGPDASERERRVLFVGGMDQAHYFKGVSLLLRSWRGVHDAYPEWTLRLIGRGDRKDAYRQEADSLGLGQAVAFLDLDDAGKHEEYASAALLVLPSLNGHEAFGLVLIEAMASGLPVVAARLPGVRTVFRDGRDGLYFEPGSEADLVGKLEKLLADDVWRAECGRSAAAYFRERYHWQAIKERYLKTVLKIRP